MGQYPFISEIFENATFKGSYKETCLDDETYRDEGKLSLYYFNIQLDYDLNGDRIYVVSDCNRHSYIGGNIDKRRVDRDKIMDNDLYDQYLLISRLMDQKVIDLCSNDDIFQRFGNKLIMFDSKKDASFNRYFSCDFDSASRSQLDELTNEILSTFDVEDVLEKDSEKTIYSLVGIGDIKISTNFDLSYPTLCVSFGSLYEQEKIEGIEDFIFNNKVSKELGAKIDYTNSNVSGCRFAMNYGECNPLAQLVIQGVFEKDIDKLEKLSLYG